MTDPPDELTSQYPERPPLSRWERWAIDETGQPIVEFDAEAHAEWCAKWVPPCPVGNPQRLRRALGFRERSVPKYLNSVIQPDHGYRPANRRRRLSEATDDTAGVEPSSRPGHRLG